MENIRREVLAAYESEYRRLADVYEEKTQRMRLLNETLGCGVNHRSTGSVINTDEHRSALRRFETLAGEITDLETRVDAARAQRPSRHADDAEQPVQLTEQLLQLSDMRHRLEEAAGEFGEIMGQELQAEHDQQRMTGGAAQAAKLELSILETSTTCTAMLLQQLSDKINRWRFMSRQMAPRAGIVDRGERGGESDAQSVRSGFTRASGIGAGPAQGRSGGPFDEPGMLVADSSVFLAAMEGNGDISFDEPGVVIFSWAGRNNSPAATAAPGVHINQCQGPPGAGHGFPRGPGGSGPPDSIF
ncbi:hypothetical protein MCOR27_010003 [Pyricularia oryzae]|uniref:Uncharacterized protein n=2 Tax=Pyricularia TaxID=48558 RepID=A0ABQ8N7Z3_PYRGI|nr:hypothetical protein MCOR01_010021 [Pyricularia oryzae]KAI6292715.1 hypothetical protein MCOR33_009662 [Pyricularia grisea]KAH9436661.1 hypothetical protein MCOR02_000332 [Pyricularia oryzae]KAI6252176.1 hypothetical protein MCOR19_011201 [Pyricularia oryzae]KAI6268795.1 hypothetical protein MCOR27_010003 [Pyricularia oryzae]